MNSLVHLKGFSYGGPDMLGTLKLCTLMYIKDKPFLIHVINSTDRLHSITAAFRIPEGCSPLNFLFTNHDVATQFYSTLFIFHDL